MSDQRQFDSGSMWRLIDEVQRMGFESAMAVARRFRQMAARQIDPDVPESEKPSVQRLVDRWQSMAGDMMWDEATQDKMLEDAQRVMDAWIDLMKSSWDAFSAMSGTWAQSASRPRPDSGPLVGSGPPGSTVSGSVALSIPSRLLDDFVKLRPGTMQDAEGNEIAGDRISLDPEELESARPGERRPVTVTIDIPPDTPQGIYFGPVFFSGDPTTVATLSVEVGA